MHKDKRSPGCYGIRTQLEFGEIIFRDVTKSGFSRDGPDSSVLVEHPPVVGAGDGGVAAVGGAQLGVAMRTGVGKAMKGATVFLDEIRFPKQIELKPGFFAGKVCCVSNKEPAWQKNGLKLLLKYR